MSSKRAPFQVLVFPYHRSPLGKVRYAVFRRTRSTGRYWQGIAGGGRVGETPLEAARREAFEEARVPLDSKYLQLDSTTTIPVVHFAAFKTSKRVFVIPEYAFGVETRSRELVLSSEHTEVTWTSCTTAQRLLKWDSNRNALWELDQRLAAIDKFVR